MSILILFSLFNAIQDRFALFSVLSVIFKNYSILLGCVDENIKQLTVQYVSNCVCVCVVICVPCLYEV